MRARAGAVATTLEVASKQLHAARATPRRAAAGGKFLRSWAHFACATRKKAAAGGCHFKSRKPGMRRRTAYRARTCVRCDGCTALRHGVEENPFFVRFIECAAPARMMDPR
jgi:hypothetical protein